MTVEMMPQPSSGSDAAAPNYEQDHLQAMTLSIWMIRPLTVRLTVETDMTPPL